jgi:hypothetical protein
MLSAVSQNPLRYDRQRKSEAGRRALSDFKTKASSNKREISILVPVKVSIVTIKS